MAVSYKIYPDLGLVHVRYEGYVVLSETFGAVRDYMQDPDFRPGQKQLVDLSRVTDFERDYATLLALQAFKADAFLQGPQSLIVYLAPTPVTRAMSRLIVRSWEDQGAVVPLIQNTEADALALLGLREQSLDELEKRSA